MIIRIKNLSKNIINKNLTTNQMWNNVLNKNKEKIFIIFDNKYKTYNDIEILSNKIANWAINKKINKNTTCPMIMNNCPEFISFWLGLSKIGAKTSLINTNLKGEPLINSIKLSLNLSNDNYFIVYGKEYENIINEIKNELNLEYENINYICYSSEKYKDNISTNDLSKILNAYEDYLTSKVDNISYNDTLYNIFTSGTTGMPKSAKINHLRFYIAGNAIKILYDIRKNDILYIPLPLYHSNGGLLAISLAWSNGLTIVLREKFSASNFISDCIKYKCTLSMYIGEICRYILNTPKNDYDKKHNLRLMIGNGLKQDIWKLFVDRFNIKMGEFYASTEGNANLFNNQNKIGSIGYLPKILQMIYPVKVIKYDLENDKLIQNSNGYYELANYNEPGELIGLIKDNDATRRFDGYSNKDDTNKKIIYNVFKKNDKWFKSGDLVKIDKEGFVYFVDRIGDTFRWKGENVSTLEVSEIVNKTNNINDSIVYGVKVGDLDGRIGMVSLKINKKFNFNELYSNIINNLPIYAQPFFIRILKEDKLTGTFKHKKYELKTEGFDIYNINDKIYYKNNDLQTYSILTGDVYKNIINGKLKL